MNPTSTSQGSRRWRRDAFFLILALCMAVAGVAGLYRRANADQVYPGVHVGAVHVGGSSPANALETIAKAGLDPAAPVVLSAGQSAHWELPPDGAGVRFDARASVEQAFNVGRGGAPGAALLHALATRFTGATVLPVVTVDSETLRATLDLIAAEYDQPAVNAGFAMTGTEIEPTPPQDGRTIDVERAAELIATAAAAGQWPIRLDLPVTSVTAEVTEAGPALAQARALMSGPIALEAGDLSWDLPSDELAPMLRARDAGNTVELAIDEASLSQWMAPVVSALETPPVNARLGFDDTTGEFVVKSPSQNGVMVDVVATGQRILAAAGAASRRIQVAEVERAAELSEDSSAVDFGIETLIHEETSFYAGSPAARVHNIQIAADRFDGVLVPPGAVFSFNEAIGDISAEEGYQKTKIIMDGTTAEGVGGGVCQVSTTLFRAAFWSGLPIVERHAHGYRVAYYEQGNIDAGLDATIYSPSVDLKFENDSPGWLLIETSANPRASTLTFRIYGPRLDREVTIDGPTIGRQTAPPAGRVEVDPSMPPGTSEKLEYARSGADVTVVRHVRGTSGERSDEFFSRYRPTGEVIAVGPPVMPDPMSVQEIGMAPPMPGAPTP